MSTHTDVAPFPPVYTSGPVCYSPEHASWEVSTYQHVAQALQLQNAAPLLTGREGTYQAAFPGGPMGRAMWARDDPAHSELRKMTAASFRAEAIAPIIASTRKFAHDLLSRKVVRQPAGSINLVEEYSSPLAAEAIDNGLVGIDPAEAPWLRAWQHAWE